jgi:hypothetical protein
MTRLEMKYQKLKSRCLEVLAQHWPGGALAMLFMIIMGSGALGFDLKSGYGTIADIIIFVTLGILTFTVTTFFVHITLKTLAFLPTGLISATVSMILLASIYLVKVLPFIIIIILVEMTLGILVWRIRKIKFCNPWKFLVIGLTLVVNITMLAWFFSPGPGNRYLTQYLSIAAPVTSKMPSLPNPALPGIFRVKTFSYGSGKDQRRKAYHDENLITVSTVDLSFFLENYKGLKAKIRTWYWGFDATQMPLNAKVWYPEADGKFPLVVIAHGNHTMSDFSEAGFAYLGELLASRGYIVVSVDMNFLNSSWFLDLGNENDARALLILKHLELWKLFNQNKGNPFYQKVDLDNIALIGHSRSGEAAAIAAMFNQLKYIPSRTAIHYLQHFNIKSVIALAPGFGQYHPTGRFTTLKNLNYLVIQGADDHDIYMFLGRNQYQQVNFTTGPYYFKTSLYVYNMNHSAFNTVWKNDDSAPYTWFWNNRSLLDKSDQRQIAKVNISAFLDATLKGKTEYISIFKNQRHAAAWLPKTVYINQFADSTRKAISDFEEDVDLASATLQGVSQSGNNYTIWREEPLSFRDDFQSLNQVVRLEWSEPTASYNLKLSPQALAELHINSNSVFTFAAADVNRALFRDRSIKNPKITPVDFSVRMIDTAGAVAEINLAEYQLLCPAFGVKLTKSNYFNRRFFGSEFEPQLQTVRIKMRDFLVQNPRFNPNGLAEIRFVFNRTPHGKIVLDDIGFEDN